MKLDDQVAIITGAPCGVGPFVARELDRSNTGPPLLGHPVTRRKNS